MSAGIWPPPVDESTVWSTMRVEVPWSGWVEVKVRQVRLWSRDVQIDEHGDVWCPACRRFRLVAELGRPDNACPVGIARRTGPFVVSEEEMLADCAAAPPGSWADLMGRLLW